MAPAKPGARNGFGTTSTRAAIWRDLSAGAAGIADALELQDEILGLLSSRAFVVAAAELEDGFWATLQDEIKAARAEAREIAAAANPDLRTYLARLSAAGEEKT